MERLIISQNLLTLIINILSDYIFQLQIMERVGSQPDLNPPILRRLSSQKQKPLLKSLDPNVKKPLLSIIHFNDVYDIQPKGGNKGICNFKAKIQAIREEYPDALTLFSGDCLSPSNLTNIKDGWQMVHALNTLKIDCACFGNHEFDFDDFTHTQKLTKACNFPWVLANITYKNTTKLLGDGKPYIIKEHLGMKIGVFGVAGSDWMGNLNDSYEDILQYESCFECGNRMAKYLRQSLRCDLVIALTHMRNASDREFPMKVEGVDLVLGGHDHVIMQEFINSTLVIKSGANFNNLGLVHLYAKDQLAVERKGRRVNYQWTIFKIFQAEKVDQQLKRYIDELMAEYKKFDEAVGYSSVALDTRFIKIRKQESNYGNFLADLARLYYDCDIVAINAGMLRNDAIMGPGVLTYSKISNIIDSPLVVKRIKGSVILKMLELSVSQFPNYTGQFLCVSGLQITFDYTKQPKVQEVLVDGKPLDQERDYTVCTTLYQARGGDGFSMLKAGQTIIDEIKGTSMLHLLLKFFKAADTHQEYESIKVLAQNLSQGQCQREELELNEFPMEHLMLVRKVSVRMGRIKELRSGFVLNKDGKKLTSISPTVDGRIKCLTKE